MTFLAQADAQKHHEPSPAHRLDVSLSTMSETSSPPPPDKPTNKQPPTQNWPKEIGGPKGPEPTRYGDWEKNGRCSDF